MPKYTQIYKQIKKRILSGHYEQNSQLPEGKKLALVYDCSELTISKALDILVKEGLVVRKRGLGSFVKLPFNASALDHHLKGTKARCKASGETLKTSVIAFSAIPAPTDVQEKLQLLSDEMVYAILRVRIIDDIPSIIEKTFMPVKIIPGLNSANVADSIYDYINDELNYSIHSSHMLITATMADELQCQLLKLTSPEIVIHVHQTAYLDNGKLFEYSIATHRYEKFKFATEYIKYN